MPTPLLSIRIGRWRIPLFIFEAAGLTSRPRRDSEDPPEKQNSPAKEAQGSPEPRNLM